jgi:hypothetical protein
MIRMRDLSFTPAPPVSFTDTARPICALAEANGVMIAVGVLQEVGRETVVFTARGAEPAAAEVQLGKIWACPIPRVGSSWRNSLHPGSTLLCRTRLRSIRNRHVPAFFLRHRSAPRRSR